MTHLNLIAVTRTVGVSRTARKNKFKKCSRLCCLLLEGFSNQALQNKIGMSILKQQEIKVV